MLATDTALRTVALQEKAPIPPVPLSAAKPFVSTLPISSRLFSVLFAVSRSPFALIICPLFSIVLVVLARLLSHFFGVFPIATTTVLSAPLFRFFRVIRTPTTIILSLFIAVGLSPATVALPLPLNVGLRPASITLQHLFWISCVSLSIQFQLLRFRTRFAASFLIAFGRETCAAIIAYFEQRGHNNNITYNCIIVNDKLPMRGQS